jgi:hypothetical protein
VKGWIKEQAARKAIWEPKCFGNQLKIPGSKLCVLREVRQKDVGRYALYI